MQITLTKKRVFLILLLLQTHVCFSQNEFDRKIIVAAYDSTGLFEKTREALLDKDYIVKEDRTQGSLTIFTRNYLPTGYIVARVMISGNRAVFFGVYGSRKIKEWKNDSIPKNYYEIVYYKGSKNWRELLKMVRCISGEVSFSR
jgi:hypothetical protein